MNDREKDYVNRVKDIANKQGNAVEVVDELAALEKPDPSDLSINTQALIESIDNLEFEREDGELDVSLESMDWKETEQRIATEIVDNIKIILADIENGNWYKRVVLSIDLVYSRLQGEDFQYKTTHKTIKPTTLEDAEKQAAEIKASIPKAYPQDLSFTLEDVRIRDLIVDSNNEVMDLRVQPPESD
jgi:hypothetical protein